MILDQLRLTNFRQYYGEQAIEFASGSKNVTVINGTTGAGKTNMFLAVNWCLYGTQGIIENKGELVNKHALDKAEKHQRITAEVELRFRHTDLEGSDSSYLAIRNSRDPETLRLSRVTRKGLEEVTNPSLVLNTILPKNVRTYFFFDGEKIDEFAKPEHEAQVKNAVYGVLKLEVLKRGREHLSVVADEYERDLKHMDIKEQVHELITKREQTNKDILDTKAKLESHQKELASASTVINRLDEVLAKQRIVQADAKRRKDLDSTAADIENDLSSVSEEIRELGSSGYLLLGKKAIQRAITIIDDKRQRGEIPAGIREQFIQDLLDKMLCICGRPISKDGAELQTLLSLLKRSMPNAIENCILETGGLLGALKSKLEHQFQAIRNAKTRKANLEERLITVNKQIDEISHRLQNIGIQEIEELEAKRKAAQKSISDLLILIGAQEQKLRDLDREITDIDHQIETAEGLQGKAKQVQIKLALARESAKAIADIYESYAMEMRKKIEEQAQDIFTKFVWKESQFTKVELTDDYRLTVLDRWNAPARPELSAGERQLLSLAFITALAKASEGSAPMVMDTPFGRLDTTPRENISKYLPNETDQLILFVTSEELHGRARDLLTSRIGHEYDLNWDKATGCTTIAPHGGH